MNRRLNKANASGVTPQSGAKGRSVPPVGKPEGKRGRSTADESDVEGRITDERTPSRRMRTSKSGGGSTCRAVAGGADLGVGGSVASLAARRGTSRGAPACSFVGRVRNLGRGGWGFGSIVGWIPANVRPWWWCRRMGWRISAYPEYIRSRQTGPLVRDRPYVLGDDGRYHLPERWEVV